MTTYLLITSDKPTELTAFVGPKKPVKGFDACHYVSAEQEFKQCHLEWQEAMETAKASRLPVVNPEEFSYYIKNAQLDTPVELEGWEPEIVYQEAYLSGEGEIWKKCSIDRFNNIRHLDCKRQAYRLKRSYPSESSVNKKFERFIQNSAHSFTEGSDLILGDYNSDGNGNVTGGEKIVFDFMEPGIIKGNIRPGEPGPDLSPIEAKTQESISFIARTRATSLEAMLLSFTHQVIVHQENRHKAQLESHKTQESQNKSLFSNSEIGSHHWAATVLSYVMRVGEYLNDHEMAGDADRKHYAAWGEGIKQRAIEVNNFIHSLPDNSKF